VTRREQADRLSFVEDETARDTPHQEIVAKCRERFGMSEAAVERAKSKVFAHWASAEAELRVARKSMARNRIMRIVDAAIASGDLKTALVGEGLLAKVEGLFSEPAERVPVTADAHRCGPVCEVVAALTPEESDKLVAEYNETERDAALWRARPQPTAVAVRPFKEATFPNG
jgi:hypothetical protein